MAITKPQRAALALIIENGGSMRMNLIKGRKVDKYRISRSLEDKGFVTRTNAGRDCPDYLHITDKGRAAS